MARIQRYQAHRKVAPYGTGVRMDPSAAAIVPRAVGEFGATLAGSGEPFLQQRRVSEFSQQSLEVTKEFAELEAWAESHQDFKTLEPEYNRRVQELREKHRKQITDPHVWRAFYEDFQKLDIRAGIKTHDLAVKREKDHNKAELVRTLDDYADMVIRSDDFQAAADALGKAQASLRGATAAGTVTETEAANLMETFQDTTQKNFVKREILADPIGTYKRLTDEKTDHYPELDEATRTDLTKYSRDMGEAFLKERLNMAIKRRNIEEALLKDHQQDQELDATIQALQGNMTETKLIALAKNRDIRRTPMLSILEVVNKMEDGEDDPYVKLLTRLEISSGRGSADEILKRVADNKLSKTTAGDMIEKLVTFNDKNDISKKPEYKDAEKYIENKLKTTGLMDKFDTSELPRIQNALDEFDQRVRSGEDIRQVRDEIVFRYRPTKEKAAELPRPLFGSKTDLKDAYLNTTNAYNAGKIKYETYKREVLNIHRLLVIQDRDAESQAAAAGSKGTEDKLKERKRKW